MILKILHELTILQYHNFQGLGYYMSSRISSIHRRDICTLETDCGLHLTGCTRVAITLQAPVPVAGRDALGRHSWPAQEVIKLESLHATGLGLRV